MWLFRVTFTLLVGVTIAVGLVHVALEPGLVEHVVSSGACVNRDSASVRW